MPGGGKPLNEGTGKVTEIAEKRRLQRNEAQPVTLGTVGEPCSQACFLIKRVPV